MKRFLVLVTIPLMSTPAINKLCAAATVERTRKRARPDEDHLDPRQKCFDLAEELLLQMCRTRDLSPDRLMKSITDRLNEPLGQKEREVPLLAAAQTGNSAMVRLLLQRGADPSTSASGLNALLSACKYGHIQVLQELHSLRKSEDSFRLQALTQDRADQNALHMAALWGHDQIITELNTLLDQDSFHRLLQQRDISGASVLHHASRNGRALVMRTLHNIMGEAPFKKLMAVRDNLGDTPVHSAATCDAASSMQTLAALGALNEEFVNLKNSNNQTAYHIAKSCNHERVAAILGPYQLPHTFATLIAAGNLDAIKEKVTDYDIENITLAIEVYANLPQVLQILTQALTKKTAKASVKNNGNTPNEDNAS